MKPAAWVAMLLDVAATGRVDRDAWSVDGAPGMPGTGRVLLRRIADGRYFSIPAPIRSRVGWATHLAAVLPSRLEIAIVAQWSPRLTGGHYLRVESGDGFVVATEETCGKRDGLRPPVWVSHAREDVVAIVSALVANGGRVSTSRAWSRHTVSGTQRKGRGEYERLGAIPAAPDALAELAAVVSGDVRVRGDRVDASIPGDSRAVLEIIRHVIPLLECVEQRERRLRTSGEEASRAGEEAPRD